MKNKSTLYLGGIFLVLVGVFLITSLHPKEVTRGATQLFPKEKPVFDKFEIRNPSAELVVLEKKGDSWQIIKPFQYKANQKAIDQLVDALSNIMIDGVISSDVSEQRRFGVDDSTGVNIKAYSGGKNVLDVILGNFTPEASHNYARMSNSKDITLWRGIFSRAAIRQSDDWRDRTIYSFNEDDITSIKAVEARQTRELAISDSIWVYKENGKAKPVNQSKVKGFIAFLASLNCDAFPAEADIPRAGSTKPDVRVSFKVRNGDTHVFDVWLPVKNEEKIYLLRKENGDMLFRFHESNGSQLALNYDKLKSEKK
ncbi:MAG: DUF4340 domain-containing protein [Candidatus Latescibacterota bacterium]